MTTPGRHHAARVVLAIGLALLAQACSSSIRFRADTTVDVDGNITRITRMAAEAETAGELNHRYLLPPGGTWTAEIEQPPPTGAPFPFEPPVYAQEYVLARELQRGEGITGDFHRKALSTDAAASNQIRVRSRRWWFIDTFHYQETFRDIVTFDGLARATHEFFDMYLDTLAVAIASGSEASVSAASARSRLRAVFDPLVEMLLTHVDNECLGVVVGFETCLEAVVEKPQWQPFLELVAASWGVDDDGLLPAELDRLFPAAHFSPGDWNEAIEDAASRLESLARSDIGIRIEESIFGVHGSSGSYPFVLSLKLPGTVVGTNGEVQDSGALHWSFRHDDFVLNDYVLSAQSRIVHMDRIVYAAIVAAFIVLAAAYLAVRGRAGAARRAPL